MDKQEKDLNIKRFGYVVSAFLLFFSNVALIKNWPVTPYLFLVTMYFLTGSLWMPVLVKPFYTLFSFSWEKGRQVDKKKKENKNYFSNN